MSLKINPFYNKSLSGAEYERDPDEHFFNEINTQNFECSYLFPNEIESFHSKKENSETISGSLHGKFQPGARLKFCSDYMENFKLSVKIFSPHLL